MPPTFSRRKGCFCFAFVGLVTFPSPTRTAAWVRAARRGDLTVGNVALQQCTSQGHHVAWGTHMHNHTFATIDGAFQETGRRAGAFGATHGCALHTQIAVNLEVRRWHDQTGRTGFNADVGGGTDPNHFSCRVLVTPSA